MLGMNQSNGTRGSVILPGSQNKTRMKARASFSFQFYFIHLLLSFQHPHQISNIYSLPRMV